MLNLCKNRKWDTVNGKHHTYTDLYFVYDLSKKEMGQYLNTWFEGTIHTSKDGLTYTDEMITLKRVDEETANHLYHRKYNPVRISIQCPTGGKFKYQDKEPLYSMKFQIHSIDDSSYSIWWSDKKLQDLKNIRLLIMERINELPIINGEEILNYCVSLGASIESKDYN